LDAHCGCHRWQMSFYTTIFFRDLACCSIGLLCTQSARRISWARPPPLSPPPLLPCDEVHSKVAAAHGEWNLQGDRAKLLGAKMDLMLLAVMASGNDYLPPLRGVALSSGGVCTRVCPSLPACVYNGGMRQGERGASDVGSLGCSPVHLRPLCTHVSLALTPPVHSRLLCTHVSCALTSPVYMSQPGVLSCALTSPVHLRPLCTHVSCALTSPVHLRPLCTHVSCIHVTTWGALLCTYISCALTSPVHLRPLCTHVPCALTSRVHSRLLCIRHKLGCSPVHFHLLCTHISCALTSPVHSRLLCTHVSSVYVTTWGALLCNYISCALTFPVHLRPLCTHVPCALTFPVYASQPGVLSCALTSPVHSRLLRTYVSCACVTTWGALLCTCHDLRGVCTKAHTVQGTRAMCSCGPDTHASGTPVHDRHLSSSDGAHKSIRRACLAVRCAAALRWSALLHACISYACVCVTTQMLGAESKVWLCMCRIACAQLREGCGPTTGPCARRPARAQPRPSATWMRAQACPTLTCCSWQACCG